MPRHRERKKQEVGVFHHFRQLPTELRLEIWKYSWEPRTITLFPRRNGHFFRPNSQNKLPASGYVNSEARMETLKHYKRSFVQVNKKAFRWFNFAIDTLCLPRRYSYLHTKLLNPDDIKKVQRLIVPFCAPFTIDAATPCRSTWPKPVTDSFECGLIEGLREANYPSLKEITITTTEWLKHDRPGTLPISYDDAIDDDDNLLRHQNFWNIPWGHMRTAYISGLRVRYTPIGPNSDQQRYCCRLSDNDKRGLIYDMIGHLETW
ncbi:hypothetical protein F4777DRAFT_536559 [Nemania sp. FL0916]|nr:hypothetical protein F4777DRAFT_536559 [Nemania sp. FL0916]